MKVTPIIKGRTDSNGHRPIQLRIHHNGKSTYKTTHIKVNPSQFKKGRVVNHPKAREYNQLIETLIIQRQAEALEGFQKKVPRTDFYKFTEDQMKHLTRRSGTVRQYYSQLNKLRRFAPNLLIQQIDKDFLNNYKSYLKKIGNEPNTIWSSFKFVRKFVNLAEAEKLVVENPFDNYEFPRYIDPDVNYLTKPEVKKIEGLKNLSPQMQEAAIWFLIGCYTGLRIADIKAFDKKKYIRDGRIVLNTQKTGEIVGLPLLPHIRKLLEKVNYQRLSMHENTYNGLLKVIAGAAGIDKNLHAHLSRHTAAMLLTDAGVSQEVIALILGHKSLSMTRKYSKVSNKRVDLEMRKVK